MPSDIIQFEKILDSDFSGQHEYSICHSYIISVPKARKCYRYILQSFYQINQSS